MSSTDRATRGSPVQASSEPKRPETLRLVKVHEQRVDGYDGTCLRPLGLCELGGCCDTCWYRPDHPRFKKGEPSQR